MKNLCTILVGTSLALTLSSGCTPRERPASANERVLVTVSIPPQKFIVKRIAGNRVDVNVMVGPGESPATYEPRPSQLADLRNSRTYFAIGVPFEKAWLPRFTAAHPDLLIVHTEAQLDLQPMACPHHHAGHDHGAHELDPHVWLDPMLVGEMASLCADTLVELMPEHAAAFDTNLTSFHAELAGLHEELQRRLADASSRSFMVFHPSWGYFARAYDLEMLPIEHGGQEPSAAEVTALIEEARAEGVRVVVVQPEFNASAAETIARQIGADVVQASPLDEDWPGLMRRMADALLTPAPAETQP